MSINEIRIG
jgi:5'-AMP-activated protein kinase catalytic alpha subunit